MLKIIADENIIFAAKAFSQFGDLKLIPGRDINYSIIKDADVLIVRSITNVNEKLINNSNVKFVGTATTGNDHIDLDYLSTKNIFFADAKGCNANSVVEYVLTSLLSLAVKKNIALKKKTIAVIGLGNIGSKVAVAAESFGLQVIKNDPPLKRKLNNSNFVSLNEALNADIITLHVPLTFEGTDKTHHLLNENNLKLIKENGILINTSRGSVVDNLALGKIIRNKKLNLIFDVWEGEPNVNKTLLDQAFIATPHIAGYSYEGKVNGTKMIFDALNKFTGKNYPWIHKLPEIENLVMEIIQGSRMEQKFYQLFSSVYDVQRDSNALKSFLKKDNTELITGFDKLRKEYPVRREFNNYQVRLSEGDSNLKPVLESLRFKVQLN